MSKVVLIPVLSGKENEKAFLLEAAGSSKLAVVVYLLDQSSGLTANEMTRELEEKEALLMEIDELLHSYSKRVKIYNEWGSWKEKIPSIAEKEEVDEIVIRKIANRNQKEIEELQSLGIDVKLI